MTTARWRTLSSSVGIPSGRVSVVEPPLGMCTRRTGGALYVPDFARSRRRLEIGLQVLFVLFRRHSIHACGAILACAPDTLP